LIIEVVITQQSIIHVSPICKSEATQRSYKVVFAAKNFDLRLSVYLLSWDFN